MVCRFQRWTRWTRLATDNSGTQNHQQRFRCLLAQSGNPLRRYFVKTIKSIFNRLGKFFAKLWQIFTALLVAPWQFSYKSDNFEEVFSFGPFILWYDVVSEWILFIRQRNPGYHVVVFEIPTSIMNILYSLGQLKFKMALGYFFVFLLDTLYRSGLPRSLAVWTYPHQLQRRRRLEHLPTSGVALAL